MESERSAGGAEREEGVNQQLEEDQPSVLDTNHMTEEPSHVTGGEPSASVADSGLSEGRDLLTDLPTAAPHLGKGKRSRSETESRISKISLISSFKSRKRSHTLHEGGVVKEKEEQEEVSYENCVHIIINTRLV